MAIFFDPIKHDPSYQVPTSGMQESSQNEAVIKPNAKTTDSTRIEHANTGTLTKAQLAHKQNEHQSQIDEISKMKQSAKNKTRLTQNPDGTEVLEEYNSNGKVIKATIYNSKEDGGGIKFIANMTYDEAGNLKSQVNKSPDGKTRYSAEYTNGKIAKECVHDSDTGELVEITTHDYDKNGNEINTITYEADGKTIQDSIHCTYNDKNKITSKTSSIGTTTYEYYANGQEKSERVDGGKSYHALKTFNEKGQPLTEESYFDFPEHTSSSINRYTYDENGNEKTSFTEYKKNYKVKGADEDVYSFSESSVSSNGITTSHSKDLLDGKIIESYASKQKIGNKEIIKWYDETGKNLIDMTVTEFGKNKKPLIETQYGPDGKTITEISKYKYDKNGEIVAKYIYGPDGKTLKEKIDLQE